MTKFMVGNSMWHLIVMSDFISKLVLIILLSMSIVCWTIFFYKYILLRIKRQHMRQALQGIKNIHNLNDVISLSMTLAKTVPGYLLSSTLGYVKELVQRREHERTLLSPREWEGVEHHMSQTFEEIMHQEEQYMPILYSCAGVGTLLGLFGTVWGLIHAFIRISEKQSADIATVAPGIAEALITTLAGLLVAIPAYIMFHYLTVQIKSLEAQLASFGDKVSWILKQLFAQ